ncbi:hypothetical protein BH23ACI1_BH23ACI1_31230 [soil metagenome]|nr:hypothetical protein [Acidobacteriota bacterium]
MEPGYMADHGYGGVFPQAWIAGRPEWSRWTGLKVKRADKMPVTTYRCPACGRLDAFAWPGTWPA